MISIRQLGDKFVSGYSPDTVEVHVIDISQDGIAFESDHNFKKNSYYDTVITLANKESISTVIEIVRIRIMVIRTLYMDAGLSASVQRTSSR